MNKILNYISDQFVFRNLKKISYGHLNLVDAKENEYLFNTEVTCWSPKPGHQKASAQQEPANEQ